MAPTYRIIGCRTDPQIKLKSDNGLAHIRVSLSAVEPLLVPAKNNIHGQLTVPNGVNAKIQMDRQDPRLPLDFSFYSVMSMKIPIDVFDCLLYIEPSADFDNSDFLVTVEELDGTILAENTSIHGSNVSLSFQVPFS